MNIDWMIRRLVDNTNGELYQPSAKSNHNFLSSVVSSDKPLCVRARVTELKTEDIGSLARR